MHISNIDLVYYQVESHYNSTFAKEINKQFIHSFIHRTLSIYEFSLIAGIYFALFCFLIETNVKRQKNMIASSERIGNRYRQISVPF